MEDDWYCFPQDLRDAFGKFFEKLQQNPFAPETLADCEYKDGYWGHKLTPEYAVYWKLHSSQLRIDILAIRKI
jgi:hypothetical protein